MYMKMHYICMEKPTFLAVLLVSVGLQLTSYSRCANDRPITKQLGQIGSNRSNVTKYAIDIHHVNKIIVLRFNRYMHMLMQGAEIRSRFRQRVAKRIGNITR